MCAMFICTSSVVAHLGLVSVADFPGRLGGIPHYYTVSCCRLLEPSKIVSA